MIFKQNREDYRVQITSRSSSMREPYLYEIKLEGSDYFGSWKGNGAFMNTDKGPFFWMLKFYKDK